MPFRRQLIFEYAGCLVPIEVFRSHPKITAESTGEVTYSINGTPVDNGIQHEEHRIWEVEALAISRGDRNALEMMVQAQNQNRRVWSPTKNYQIILHDWIAEYQQFGTARSRALAKRSNGAITSPVTPITGTAGTAIGLSYYAQWNVRFVDRPEWEDTRTNSSLFGVKFKLKELDRRI
jgi:hypothetical protein